MTFVKIDYELRPVKESDKHLILCWRNQPHVRDFMYTDHEITVEEHDAWFEKALEDPDACYLILEQLGAPVAFTNFTSIDRKNNKCIWGFYLTSSHPQQGTGSVMAWFLLDHCFRTMGLRKLYCESFAFNCKACSLYLKFGFTQEAHLRQHILKKGRYEDVLGFGLLSEEWSQLRDNLAKSLFK